MAVSVKLFGITCQQITSDIHKQQIIMTLEKSGFVHGTRMHTILTESHKPILTKHTFYISTRTRAPSWWLIFTKIDGRAKAILVEPLRIPKLYIWPGRWDESLCNGDGTVFSVQCPIESSAKTIIIEDLYLGSSVSWAETPFSERWKAACKIFETQYIYDEIINPIQISMKKYYSISTLSNICKKGSLVEFMPDDCGKRRFLFEMIETPTIVKQVVEHETSMPIVVETVVATPEILFKTFGLVYEPALPDTYYLCELDGTFVTTDEGQKTKALVRILATSRMLYKQYQNSPDKTYIWKCKWNTGINRWEPYEFTGTSM